MIRLAATTVILGCVLVLSGAASYQQSYDILIRNGRVLDGTGSPWYRADIAIRGDAIVRIAKSIEEPAVRALGKRVKESFDPKGVLNPGRMWAGA